MQAKMMGKRRSEVDVSSLRPLALNRATTEVVPARGTLFLKGVCTQLMLSVLSVLSVVVSEEAMFGKCLGCVLSRERRKIVP